MNTLPLSRESGSIALRAPLLGGLQRISSIALGLLCLFHNPSEAVKMERRQVAEQGRANVEI